MKIGISAFAWTARFEQSHLDLVPVVKSMGIDALEVSPAEGIVRTIRLPLWTAKPSSRNGEEKEFPGRAVPSDSKATR
jgi:hypothetical protein